MFNFRAHMLGSKAHSLVVKTEGFFKSVQHL